MSLKSISFILSIIKKYFFKRKHMSSIIESFNKINSNIEKLNPTQKVNIVAVSKTFPLDHIKPLIDFGHNHFGENKSTRSYFKMETNKNSK